MGDRKFWFKTPLWRHRLHFWSACVVSRPCTLSIFVHLPVYSWHSHTGAVQVKIQKQVVRQISQQGVKEKQRHGRWFFDPAGGQYTFSTRRHTEMSQKWGNWYNAMPCVQVYPSPGGGSRPGQTAGGEKARNVIKIGRSGSGWDFTAHMSLSHRCNCSALFWGMASMWENLIGVGFQLVQTRANLTLADPTFPFFLACCSEWNVIKVGHGFTFDFGWYIKYVQQWNIKLTDVKNDVEC